MINVALRKEIMQNDIKRILRKIYNEKIEIENYHLIEGGFNNTSYYIKPINYRALVLRIAPDKSDIYFSYDKDIMRNEPEIYRILKENDIPIPNIIYSDFTNEIIDRDYIVFEHINGITLHNAKLSVNNSCDIYKEAGRISAKINSIENNMFGRPFTNDRYTFSSWTDFILCYTHELCIVSYDCETLDREIIKAFDNIINKNLSCLKKIITPRLIHNDYWQGNIMLQKSDENNYEIAAVIDTERALYGDNIFEFVMPHILAKPFYQGYGNNLDKDLQSYRMEIYRLIRDVLDIYVFSKHIIINNILDDIKKRFYSRMKQFD